MQVCKHEECNKEAYGNPSLPKADVKYCENHLKDALLEFMPLYWEALAKLLNRKSNVSL